MVNTGHLAGLREKMAKRDDKRRSQKGNKAPTGQRIAVPATPPRNWPGNHKSRPGPVGRPYVTHLPSEPRKLPLNRWTGKPHEHRREIARRLRRGVPA